MKTIEDQFIPYNLALKLKEMGFNERCLAGYYNDGKNLWFFRFHKNSEREPTVAERFATAPLWQQAFDWFREKGIDSWVSKSFGCYNVNIVKTNDEQENEDVSYGLTWKDFKTYEEARKACLEKLIELCQQN